MKGRLSVPACDRPRRLPSGASYDALHAENLEEQGDLLSKIALVSSKVSNQWSRHYGSNESHDHKHGENPLREDTHIIAYIEGNASTKFSRRGYGDNDQADKPILSAVEEADLGAQTGESKEHWQQQD